MKSSVIKSCIIVCPICCKSFFITQQIWFWTHTRVSFLDLLCLSHPIQISRSGMWEYWTKGRRKSKGFLASTGALYVIMRHYPSKAAATSCLFTQPMATVYITTVILEQLIASHTAHATELRSWNSIQITQLNTDHAACFPTSQDVLVLSFMIFTFHHWKKDLNHYKESRRVALYSWRFKSLKSHLDVMMDILRHRGQPFARAVCSLLPRAPLARAEGGARGEEVWGGEVHQAHHHQQEQHGRHPEVFIVWWSMGKTSQVF